MLDVIIAREESITGQLFLEQKWTVVQFQIFITSNLVVVGNVDAMQLVADKAVKTH